MSAVCPYCNARVEPSALRCPSCKGSLPVASRPSPPAPPAARVSAPRPPPPPPGSARPPAPPPVATLSQRARLPLGPVSGRGAPPPPAPVRAPPSAAPPPPPAPARGVPPRPPPAPVVRRPDPPPPHPSIVNEEEGETASVMTNPLLRPSAGEWLQGRYELLRVLDDGVFGTTWQARDTRSGHLVALKLVTDALVMNDGERRELAAKLEMFCGRSLAGCVMPTETVIIPGGIGVVSTLVDGVSLRSVMDARRARSQGLTPEECVRLLLSIVSALQALHTSSPHGGLRPENVLVTARGVLLTDCVLGVSFPPDRLHQRIARFRPRAADYNAPELALGRRPTASADLFALGAMAAELAGGKALSEGPDLASISRELHRAVGTLLDRDPGRRPGGVRQLLDALTQAAGMDRRPPEPPLPVPESVQAVTLLGDEDGPAAPVVSVVPAPPPPTVERAVTRTLDERDDDEGDDEDDASQERTVVGPMPRPPGEDPDAATDHFRRTPPPKDALVPAPPARARRRTSELGDGLAAPDPPG
jgi:serine/threonine protein kinase